MVLPQPLTLSAEAVAHLAELENLGESHLTLKPVATWRPEQARRTLDQEIHAELAGLGLFDRRGRVEVEVAASLAVLCRPTTEFYGWIQREDRTIGVLAAAIGREAILAVRDGTEVRLRQIGTKTLAEALTRQTADVSPAQGAAISFLQSEALTAVDGRQATEAGVRTVPASREVRLAQRIASQPITGGGQLSVACRDRMGRRRVSEHPLRYADTANGRWLNHTTALPTGDNRILLVPASRSDLAARLRETHRALLERTGN